MAAAVCCTVVSDSLQHEQRVDSHQLSHEPINFLYGHLHNAIRTELDALSTWALPLEADNEEDLLHQLVHLKERYHFLEQVYKYHSSVEDEVVYPALDTKVKNVTSAYVVEHRDEEYLFEHLASLLTSALSQSGTERTATIRELICKIEEINITLRKHLAKEEAQLLPLLLQHFNHAEQAELVAQFLYCIPLDTVERVLSWLKPMVPMEELLELMQQLQAVIPDQLLLQLLVTWLSPVPSSTAPTSGRLSIASAGTASIGSLAPVAQVTAGAVGTSSKLAVSPFASGAGKRPIALTASAGRSVTGVSNSHPSRHSPAGSAQEWPALRGIVLFHHSIRGALEVFASEAAALQQQSGVTASQLAGLVERHRFLRSVCMFHTLSEEEVMFPEVLRISSVEPNLASVIAACGTCQQEHTSEVVLFEELGRLLADVRSFVRRGRTRDVSGMLGKLVDTAQKVCLAISTHMQREEQEVLPLLAASLSPAQQRSMVWRTLRAMPLRLLERVLPWLLSKLSPEDAEGMMTSLRLGATQVDQQLVELLLRWAQRGRWPLPDANAPEALPPAAQGSGQQRTTLGNQQVMEDLPVGATAPAAAVETPAAADDQLQELNSVAADVIEDLCRSCGTSTRLNMSAVGSAAEQQQPGSPVNNAALLQQWASHDPCYFGNNTCELHLIRQASNSSGSPRKRQRLGDSSGSGCDNCSSEDVTPKAATVADEDIVLGSVTGAAAAAAAACSVALQGIMEQQQQSTDSPDTPVQPTHGQFDEIVVQQPPAAIAACQQPVSDVRCSSSSGTPPGCNPIDHIFQFHKALKRELKQLEADAAALERAVLNSCEAMEQQQAAATSATAANGSNNNQQLQELQQPVASDVTTSAASAVELLKQVSRALQQLDGRFHFLWGIYRAHSKAEDEIVFPALESKEALHNVSHAYTLDHEQEEQLFLDVAAVISKIKSSASAAEARDLVLQLRRMCAAVRASLETHVRAEETELWPLFSEHFSINEQQHLVGIIIGRTGAEVLQALLPWVTGSFSEEEKEAMMGSLREATKNTMFDQWLGAVQSSNTTAPGNNSSSSVMPVGANLQLDSAAAAAAVAVVPGVGGSPTQQQLGELAEVAEYLAVAAAGSNGDHQQQQQHVMPVLPQTEVSGTVAESTNYVPGWEDIFNINQKQLEAAIRRVSNDPNLEPQRKAYLIQNIMVSRYIVAQQRRMVQQGSGALQQQPATIAAGVTAASLATPSTQQQHQQGLHVAGGCCHHGHAPQQQQQALLDAGGNAGGLQLTTAVAPVAAGVAQKTFADASLGVLGCKHYRRSAQLVAPCCGKVYTCRICHDEASDHRLDRYAVKQMVCMLCNTRQPVAGTCSICHSSMSSYYCGICHLFDDEPGRDIYHCPFCNVCRRGKGLGVDFFHCMQCNACMSLSLFNSHTCRERAMEGNCPVCHEYLFDSATPIKELPCGHFLHSSCFAEYARYSYTCPICCKSIGDMSMYFQMLDSLLASERSKMPVEYAGRQQQVLCQDCGKVGMAPYHFVYHACPSCHSYNTRVL